MRGEGSASIGAREVVGDGDHLVGSLAGRPRELVVRERATGRLGEQRVRVGIASLTERLRVRMDRVDGARREGAARDERDERDEAESP